jgi:aquaporin Z
MTEAVSEPVAAPTNAHKLGAEVLGTFVLVFFGCGAALISGGDYVATGLTFGLTVVVMAYSVGRISGGHFNPAVTIGAAVGGRLPWREVGLYIGAQLAGAIGAGLSLWVLMHGFEGFSSTENGFAQNSFGDDGTGYAWWAAFLLEALLTLVFLMIILAVTDSRNEHPVMAPLAIGLALAMIHFASMGATGTSVNPARSIGVGLFAGSDAVIQLWLFILAPLLGGAAAGLLYPVLFGGDEPVPGSGLRFSRPAPVGFAGGVPGYGAPDQYQQQWNQPDAGGAPFGQHPQAYQGHQPQPQQYDPQQYGGQYGQQSYGQQEYPQQDSQQYGGEQYGGQYGQQYGQQYTQPPQQQGYPQHSASYEPYQSHQPEATSQNPAAQHPPAQNPTAQNPTAQYPPAHAAPDPAAQPQEYGTPAPPAAADDDPDGEDGRTQVRPPGQ